MLRASKAYAVIAGRPFVTPDDVRSVAAPVLAHRLVLDTRARYAGADKRALMKELSGAVPVPR